MTTTAPALRDQGIDWDRLRGAVQRERQRRAWTYDRLARECRVTAPTIHRFETGATVALPDLLVRLVILLDPEGRADLTVWLRRPITPAAPVTVG
jgi:transcriptional regulator with XRE-family HTH domain